MANAPLLESTSSACVDAARVILRRLSDQDRVDEAVARAAQVGESFGWIPHSFAAGYGGIALALDEGRESLGAVESETEPWASDAVLGYVSKIAKDTSHHPIDSDGLFTGASGLAWVLERLSISEPRFRHLGATTSQSLHAEFGSPVADEDMNGASFLDFDLVSGVSGRLLYALASTSSLPQHEKVAPELVGYLSQLVAVGPSDHLPAAWHTPSGKYPTDQYREAFPHGLLNLGLSHGLPGIMLALSKAVQVNILPERASAALERSIEWILESRGAEAWPWARGVNAAGRPESVEVSSPMYAWCYGDPGVCLALRTAGEALGSADLVNQADQYFEHALGKYLENFSTMSPTICHGKAGVAVIADHFARRGNDIAEDSLELIANSLVSDCDPDLLLGVQDLENGGARVDDPGLLTGASGVAMVLLHLSVGTRPGAFLPFIGE